MDSGLAKDALVSFIVQFQCQQRHTVETINAKLLYICTTDKHLTD